MTVVAFLGTFLGGGVLGVVLRASHERSERARDRLLDAAERFLSAHEASRAALDVYRERTGELMIAEEAGKAVEQAEAQRLEALEPARQGPIHDAAVSIHRPFSQWLPRRPVRFNQGWDERTRQEFDAELADARRRLGEAAIARDIPPEVDEAIGNTLNAVESLVRARDEQVVAFGAWERSAFALSGAVARVMVVFAPRRRVRLGRWKLPRITSGAPDVVAAHNAATALSSAALLVDSERNAGRNPGMGNDAVSTAINAAAVPLGEFARLSNRSLRRMWL